MSYVKALNSALHRLLVTQLVLMVVMALGGFLISGLPLGIALFYGGGIAFVNTLQQQWYATRAERAADNDPARNMRLL